MNEYLKNNFGYEITGDLESLREAKASLEVTKAGLKDEYMSAKYVENMLMLETIKSLLKAHGITGKTPIIESELSSNVEKVLHTDSHYSVVEVTPAEQATRATIVLRHWEKEISRGFYEPMDDAFVMSFGDKTTRMFETPEDLIKFMKVGSEKYYADRKEDTSEEVEEDAEPMNEDEVKKGDIINHRDLGKLKVWSVSKDGKEYKVQVGDSNNFKKMSYAELKGSVSKKKFSTSMREEDVTVDNEGNISGYLDTIDEYVEMLFKSANGTAKDVSLSKESATTIAHRIQNAVDDIRIRELKIKPSNLRQNYESVNEEKISVDGQGSVETDYYTVIVSSGDMGIVVDIKDKNDNEIDSRQYWDEDAIGEGKEPVTEDDNEEKGPDHYRWKNDSQLSIAKDKLIACMAQLDHAIDYRAENSHLFFNTGDKAGTGDLYRMKEQLEKLHDGWEEATELYGM
jgi:hypothetical protein